jgi:hypothetical protein
VAAAISQPFSFFGENWDCGDPNDRVRNVLRHLVVVWIIGNDDYWSEAKSLVTSYNDLTQTTHRIWSTAAAPLYSERCCCNLFLTSSNEKMPKKEHGGRLQIKLHSVLRRDDPKKEAINTSTCMS